MSKEVTVTGMQMKAKATDGLVISGDNKTTWITDWDVAMNAGVELYPTSTDGTTTPTWVYAESDNFDDADKEQDSGDYTALSFTYKRDTLGDPANLFSENDEGLGHVANPDRDYVLVKNFYIKSTGEADWTKDLYINDVTATVTGSETEALDKALRVLVIVTPPSGYGTASATVYAPIEGYDSTAKGKGTTTLTLVPSGSETKTGTTKIGITDETAVKVQMYMYYEGEDANCKSSNVSGKSVDTLKVSAEFGVKDDAGTGA